MTCPECKGSGRTEPRYQRAVVYQFEDVDREYPERMTWWSSRPCPWCDGEGEVDEDEWYGRAS